LTHFGSGGASSFGGGAFYTKFFGVFGMKEIVKIDVSTSYLVNM